MQGAALDVVLLLLLILFFGVQQRSRPELFFRFWFVGWMAVSLSFVTRMLPFASAEAMRWEHVLRSNLMLMGAMCFMVSFVATRERLLRTILIGMTFGIPAKLLMDAQILYRPPVWVLWLLVVVAQGAGIHAVHVLLPRDWRWRRRAILTLCVVLGASMLMLAPGDNPHKIQNLMLAQMYLSVAVLYGGAHARRSCTGFGGSLGFLAWGGFYLVAVWLPMTTGPISVLYGFWNVPKYFVGFAMILQIFEDSRAEFARLAGVYRMLYDDFRLMYENYPHPMWIYEAETKKLLSANVAAATTYGFSEQEMLGMRMTDLELPEDEDAESTNVLIMHPADGRRTRHRHKDGSVAWVNVLDRAILFQGNEARCVIARDVTKQLKLNRELAHRAHHDALTGLPNRVLLESRIQQCLDRCAGDERKAVLLTIDVDHFKRINDTYGHQVGDECLQAVAGRLKSKIRQMDTIARAGGEEFVAIVGGLTTVADARKVAASLLAMFETPLHLSCGIVPLTVSIGGAVFPEDGMDMAELQFKSDQALYGAKRTGRNRAVFAAPEASPSLLEQPGRAWMSVPAEGVPVKARA